ncbi:virulence factor Mce-like protein [Herbihabitans rhizosphaerae]|uniref:Virulence factor Mce-like protein n=1 Tax=Herbihabitans rhizosphaerae TaxID=1872711 RepID=A0A4V2ESD6_9PSEU|nr:MCE family protein [Herbihabitans rhizosphaerae]RZS37203.1 virulence factor Mce-like protein [Herbihabitans rhizosphaerae]
MTATSRTGRNLATAVAAACVLALVLAAALWWVLRETSEKRYTAMFTGTVGLYEQNDVRVLGVKVGKVEKIEPQGDQVKVEFVVNADVQIPAEAKAVIVAPSLVSDRYIQMTPAYTGGRELAEGVVLARDRTATPLETDDLYDSLNRVTSALGPNGANKNGALSDLLNTLAKNLDGTGQVTHDTITQLGKAASTLSGNQGDLFATVDNLQKFTSALAGSDQQVNQFVQQLASVNKFLAGERGDFALAVRELGTALGTVQKFIDSNRGKIKTNVDKLASITKVLVDQRASLAETLDLAPLALSNLAGTWNASSQTLDARPQLNELTQPPIVMICNLVKQLTPAQLPPVLGDTCKQLAPVIQGLVPLPSVGQVIEGFHRHQLPSLPLPLAGAMYGTPPPGGK